MINELFKFGSLIFGIVISVVYIYGYKKLSKKECEIFELKAKIDNIESDNESKRILGSGMVNKSQFERMTEKRKKPMDNKLETLKMERQFLLEKIPLLSIFKR